MQICTTGATTCPKAVRHRPSVSWSVEARLPDSRVRNHRRVTGADVQTSLHWAFMSTGVMSIDQIGLRDVRRAGGWLNTSLNPSQFGLASMLDSNLSVDALRRWSGGVMLARTSARTFGYLNTGVPDGY